MSTKSTGGGITFVQALLLLFIGLKLGHVINWSWWWVLSPLWITIGIGVVVIVGLLVVLAVSILVDWALGRRHRKRRQRLAQQRLNLRKGRWT